MAPGAVPIVAVTGTNGKTTVTTLVQAMLEASGMTAVAAGNIGLPLLDAVAGDAEVVVAEVSSFQLALTTSFHPVVGAWINFSADHLDWHASVDDYRDAKTRLWANTGPGDVAVANLEDPVVMAASALPRARGAQVRTFGLHGGTTPCAPGSSWARTGPRWSRWSSWPGGCRTTWPTHCAPRRPPWRRGPAPADAGRRWWRSVGSPIVWS